MKMPVKRRVQSYGCIVEGSKPDDEDESVLHLFVDSSDVVADVLFKEWNIGHLLDESCEATNSRVMSRFIKVLDSYSKSDDETKRKTHLTMKSLTLGVCTGLKGRHLTQAKSDTQKILAKMDTETDRKEGWSDLITLERMHMSELRSVAAEISFQT